MEVLFNVAESSIEITENFIALEQSSKLNWAGSIAIACGNNVRATAEIRANVVVTTGTGGIAFFLSGDHSDAKPLTVSNNISQQWAQVSAPHVAAFMLSSNLDIPSFPGRTYADENIGYLRGVRISNNYISGTANFGFVTFDAGTFGLPTEPRSPARSPRVLSNHNEIRDNSFLCFTAVQYELCFTPDTHDNTATGSFDRNKILNANPTNSVTISDPIPWNRKVLTLLEVPTA